MKLWVIAALAAGGYIFFRNPNAKKQTGVTVKTPNGSGSVTSTSQGTTVNVQIPKLQTKADTIIFGEQLTADEQSGLNTKSNDLLAAEGLVTMHKAYAAAIANKLASAGDLRAQAVNYRVANWSAMQMQLPPEAVQFVVNPLNFTFDQIFEAAGSSESAAFKQWAAQLLSDNNRAEQASILRGQIAAT